MSSLIAAEKESTFYRDFYIPGVYTKLISRPYLRRNLRIGMQNFPLKKKENVKKRKRKSALLPKRLFIYSNGLKQSGSKFSKSILLCASLYEECKLDSFKLIEFSNPILLDFISTKHTDGFYIKFSTDFHAYDWFCNEKKYQMIKVIFHVFHLEKNTVPIEFRKFMDCISNQQYFSLYRKYSSLSDIIRTCPLQTCSKLYLNSMSNTITLQNLENCGNLLKNLSQMGHFRVKFSDFGSKQTFSQLKTMPTFSSKKTAKLLENSIITQCGNFEISLKSMNPEDSPNYSSNIESIKVNFNLLWSSNSVNYPELRLNDCITSSFRGVSRHQKCVIYYFCPGKKDQQYPKKGSEKVEEKNLHSCVWCGLSFIGKYSASLLLLHLRFSHDTFKYSSFLEKIHKATKEIFHIRVTSNVDQYELQVQRNELSVMVNSKFSWSRRHKNYFDGADLLCECPTLPNIKIVSMESIKSNQAKNSLKSKKILPENCENQIGANCEYYNSNLFIPLKSNEMEVDSDDGVDHAWLLKKNKSILEEYQDVSVKEKSFMKLWDTHVFQFLTSTDKGIPLSCKVFVKRHGPTLVTEELLTQFHCHMMNLWDLGLVSADNMMECSGLLNDLKLRLKVEERISVLDSDADKF